MAKQYAALSANGVLRSNTKSSPRTRSSDNDHDSSIAHTDDNTDFTTSSTVPSSQSPKRLKDSKSNDRLTVPSGVRYVALKCGSSLNIAKNR